MAQNQTLVNYESIIELFKKKHGRAHAIFETIYPIRDTDLYFMLVRREWKRWYAYKRCIRLVEIELAGTESWVALHLCEAAKQVLRSSCAKLCNSLKLG